MPLLSGDLFIVERGGVQYEMNSDELKTFIRSNFIYADITARDAATSETGDIAYVVDASADATVTTGGAKYIYDGTVWIKTAEDESMDVVIAPTDLGYTASPTQGEITNTAGANAVLPVVTATNAGLATPAMLANSHPAAAAGLTAATNPVIVNAGTQVVTFSIDQLDPLP